MGRVEATVSSSSPYVSLVLHGSSHYPQEQSLPTGTVPTHRNSPYLRVTSFSSLTDRYFTDPEGVNGGAVPPCPPTTLLQLLNSHRRYQDSVMVVLSLPVPLPPSYSSRTDERQDFNCPSTNWTLQAHLYSEQGTTNGRCQAQLNQYTKAPSRGKEHQSYCLLQNHTAYQNRAVEQPEKYKMVVSRPVELLPNLTSPEHHLNRITQPYQNRSVALPEEYKMVASSTVELEMNKFLTRQAVTVTGSLTSTSPPADREMFSNQWLVCRQGGKRWLCLIHWNHSNYITIPPRWKCSGGVWIQSMCVYGVYGVS